MKRLDVELGDVPDVMPGRIPVGLGTAEVAHRHAPAGFASQFDAGGQAAIGGKARVERERECQRIVQRAGSRRKPSFVGV